MSRAKIQFTEAMNEVSGLGGFYERCCRAGVIAGATWLRSHPRAMPPVFSGYDGVFGVVTPENATAKALEQAVLAGIVTRDDGTKSVLRDELTGAQFHAITHHLLYIAANGWDAYREHMSQPIASYAENEEEESEK